MNKLLLVITGKTASGKDTVASLLLKKFPDFRKILTTTSRALRQGETEGIDYHFISREEFTRKTETDSFVEFVEYAGNLYGTEKSQILGHLDHNLIWRIDPSRAGQVRELISTSFDSSLSKDLLTRVVVVYITVDDNVALERLKQRGLSVQEIAQRMADDKKFWQEYQGSYDFVIENEPGKLNKTLDKIVQIMENHHS